MAEAETTEEVKEENPLDISDEEFLKKDWDEFLKSEEALEVLDSEESKESDEVDEQDADDSVEDDSSIEDSDTEETDPEDDKKADKEEDTSKKTSTETEEDLSEAEPFENDGSDEDSKGTVDVSKDTKEEQDIDYKQTYFDLLKPFKANGRMMQIENVEDARSLMQMGANYNKKMAGLKPHLKVIKTLEKNDLLDEDKLNFLIDLNKQNPEAIKKLISDSGIDPLEIDKDKESTYTSSNHMVSDQEVVLDTVLDSIKGTKGYTKTLDIISNMWDSTTKSHFIDNPHLIPHLNTQVESGIFDRVMGIVERERALGRINGLNDIQAYEQIGEQLYANGDLKDLLQPMNASSKRTSTSTKTVKKADPKLKDKKRAASSTKGTGTKAKVKEGFNPLSMPDEEFEKLVLEQYI